MTEPILALRFLAPQLVVALTGALILVIDLVWMKPVDSRSAARPMLAYVGVAGLVVAAIMVLARAGSTESLLWDTMVVDPLTVYFDLLFIAVGIVVLLISIDPLPKITEWAAEYYALVVWCTLGNMLVAAATELFTLFLCFQLTSLPLIILIGVGKRERRVSEAALKYLVIVLVSTALFLYGLSLVYGVFGTSEMAAIGEALRNAPLPPLAAAGLVLMLAGFGFKVTAAPFQHWVPDVYQGAPTPVTAFLSVGSKLAGFALIMRFLVIGLGANESFRIIFGVLAVASMLIGNLGALKQTNIKRLLAYSGIAQAGYVLVGLAALSSTGVAAVLFYLAAYAVANLLAFTVINAYTTATGSEEVADYAGLAGRSPLAAFGLAAALMSLAGLPLTAGFMAKFYVFLAAAQTGEYWLVLVAVVNAVLAFYYYLRIVWNLFVPETDREPISMLPRARIIIAACTIGIVGIGVFPGPLLTAADHVARTLFGL